MHVFVSGERGRKEYTAGVGMVISNEFMQYAKDIEPINDRLVCANRGAPLRATSYAHARPQQKDKISQFVRHF